MRGAGTEQERAPMDQDVKPMKDAFPVSMALCDGELSPPDSTHHGENAPSKPSVFAVLVQWRDRSR